MRVRICMHNLQLNFSDLSKYSSISEINYTQNKSTKILIKSSRFISCINFENRLILYISKDCFLNHWRETEKITKSNASSLWHQPAFAQMTKYVIAYLFSAHFALKQISVKHATSGAGIFSILKTWWNYLESTYHGV